MAQHVLETISTAQHLQQALTKAPANAKTAVNDLQAQLDDLVFPGFLLRHPAAQLPHLPRYLKGMSLRLAKLAHHLPRDISNMNDMTKLEAAFRKRCQHAADEPNAELEQFRWLLQELRVSLFAQELKTPMPVSVKRLEKRWQEICDG
jgi:ATP-dependent helicase HrpA